MSKLYQTAQNLNVNMVTDNNNNYAKCLIELRDYGIKPENNSWFTSLQMMFGILKVFIVLMNIAFIMFAI